MPYSITTDRPGMAPTESQTQQIVVIAGKPRIFKQISTVQK